MKIKNIDLSNTLIFPSPDEANYLHCSKCLYFYEGICYTKSVAAGIISIASSYNGDCKTPKSNRKKICNFIKTLPSDYLHDESDINVLQFE